jgi:hypothetical protein
MRTIQLFNAFHLGDGFANLHLLRYLALRHPEMAFEFYAHQCYLQEFVCFTEDVPNLTLFDLERGAPPKAIDGWKQSENFFASHPLRNDYAAFTKRHYRRLIRKFGLNDPAPGLLFDLPCLAQEVGYEIDFDVLVVNSNPQSGQFLDYTQEDSLEPMVRALMDRGHRVITTKPSRPYGEIFQSSGVDLLPNCTQDSGLKCWQIGALSNRIPVHIMVSTGPSWLTFNTFSNPTYRLIMSGQEHVNIVPHVWARTIGQAMGELKRAGLI